VCGCVGVWVCVCVSFLTKKRTAHFKNGENFSYTDLCDILHKFG